MFEADRILSVEPARELTSREVAKIVCSLIGGFAQWIPKETVRSALLFCVKHLDRIYDELKP